MYAKKIPKLVSLVFSLYLGVKKQMKIEVFKKCSLFLYLGIEQKYPPLFWVTHLL